MTVSGSDDLGADVKTVIDQCVRSVGHLETLLFLFHHPDRAWSALEISNELRTNESLAELQLRELCPSLVEKVGSAFRFAKSETNDVVLNKLSDLYRERRHAIINYIYMRPPDSLRSFADAFRLKKD